MKRFLLIFYVIFSWTRVFAFVMQYDDSHIIYGDETTHLQYMLDMNTREASLGNGIDPRENAIYKGGLFDEMDWYYDPSVWATTIVPEKVQCMGVEYTVTSVAKNAFSYCTCLKNITLPATIRQICSYAFNLCSELESISIPEGVTIIADNAFSCCVHLNQIHLPSTIESIGSSAFIDCKSLKSINIPGGCRTVGNDAFSWCLALQNLIIEDGESPLKLGYAYSFGPLWEPYSEPFYYERSFYRGLFNDCSLRNIYVGRNLEFDIVDKIISPFERNYKWVDTKNVAHYTQTTRFVDNIEFGDFVTEIHANLFADVRLSNEMQLPKNVKTIGDGAFNNCLSQVSITIPESCDSIGFLALGSQNSNLLNVYCPSVPPRIRSSLFNANKVVLFVPAGKREVYKNNENWKGFFMCDPEDELTEINVKYANSLYGRLSLLDLEPGDVTRLKLEGKLGSDDLEVIGQMTNLYELDLSSMSCDDLSPMSKILPRLVKFEFPHGIQKLEQNLFLNAHLTGKVVIPESCEVIEQSAFSMASLIDTLIIMSPCDVQSYAISNCQGIKYLAISNGAKVQKNGISGSNSLNTLIIGNDVSLAEEAISSSPKMRNIYINGKDVTLGTEAFGICDSIDNMTINGGFKYIASKAFKFSYGEPILKNLNINNISGWAGLSFQSEGDNPLSFAQHVYINGDSLCDVTISDDVNIGDYAFSGCSVLNSLTLRGKSAIGKGSFANCENLHFADISSAGGGIGEGAFQNCGKLTGVNLPKNLSVIEKKVFADCSSLKQLSISEAIQKIGKRAFANCTALETINVPNSCQSLGEGAFYGCTSLSKLQLPYNLTAIADSAFANCTALKDITALWVTPPVIATSVLTNLNKKCILNVPVESVPNYYENGWGRVALIEEGFHILESSINIGGTISSLGYSSKINRDCFVLELESDREFSIVPDDNYYVKSVLLDGERLMTGINSTAFKLENIASNHQLNVRFDRYLTGDVNDDDYIDVGDILDVVGYIREDSLGTFIVRAADINQDERIDVGDIRGIVNIICDFYGSTPRSVSKSKKISEDRDFSIMCEGAFAKVADSERTLSVGIASSHGFVGFQTEIVLPEGLYIPNKLSGEPMIEISKEYRNRMNIVSVSRKKNGNCLVICTSDGVESEYDGICNDLFTMTLRSQNEELLSDPDLKIQLSGTTISYPDASVSVKDFSVPVCSDSTDAVEVLMSETNPKNATRKVLQKGRVTISSGDRTYNINGNLINL